MQRIAAHLLETEDGTPRWQTLLIATFEHAFDWLGFGAKTAVGYGVMAPTDTAKLPPESPQRETWEQARVIYTPNDQELTATKGDLKARLQGESAKALFGGLSKAKQKKLKGGATMDVEVEGSGEVWKILGLR